MTTPRADVLVLVGFMAAGKSTVGRLLAQRLGWSFVDLDATIERNAGLSVAEIFAEQGEPVFRRLETEATRSLAGRRGLVLAPGGGWFLRPENRAALSASARTVWLRVTAEEAVRRSGAASGERPLLAGDDPLRRAAALLAEREPTYGTADWIVDTSGRSVDEIADEIAERAAADL